MKISVEHIYGGLISKMHANGWRIRSPIGCSVWDDPKKLSAHRRNCGVVMEKDFISPREAMQEFEKISGEDIIEHTDQMGCSVFVFWWEDEEGNHFASGWGCGEYLYDKWYKTPRKCLEALNKGQNEYLPKRMD